MTTFLYALHRSVTPSSSQGEEDNAVPQVTWADDLKPSSTRRTWCKATFFLPQFAEINECAYFDYQRDKVFVRTNPALARVSRRRKKSIRARRLRVNDRVELTVDECPHCKSKDLVPSERRGRKKMLFDLKLAPPAGSADASSSAWCCAITSAAGAAGCCSPRSFRTWPSTSTRQELGDLRARCPSRQLQQDRANAGGLLRASRQHAFSPQVQGPDRRRITSRPVMPSSSELSQEH